MVCRPVDVVSVDDATVLVVGTVSKVVCSDVVLAGEEGTEVAVDCSSDTVTVDVEGASVLLSVVVATDDVEDVSAG